MNDDLAVLLTILGLFALALSLLGFITDAIERRDDVDDYWKRSR